MWDLRLGVLVDVMLVWGWCKVGEYCDWFAIGSRWEFDWSKREETKDETHSEEQQIIERLHQIFNLQSVVIKFCFDSWKFIDYPAHFLSLGAEKFLII